MSFATVQLCHTKTNKVPSAVYFLAVWSLLFFEGRIGLAPSSIGMLRPAIVEGMQVNGDAGCATRDMCHGWQVVATVASRDVHHQPLGRVIWLAKAYSQARDISYVYFRPEVRMSGIYGASRD